MVVIERWEPGERGLRALYGHYGAGEGEIVVYFDVRNPQVQVWGRVRGWRRTGTYGGDPAKSSEEAARVVACAVKHGPNARNTARLVHDRRTRQLDGAAPTVTSRTAQVAGVGGFSLNTAGTDLYYWHQVGWISGNLTTSVKRQSWAALTLIDESTVAYSENFQRDRRRCLAQCDVREKAKPRPRPTREMCSPTRARNCFASFSRGSVTAWRVRSWPRFGPRLCRDGSKPRG